MIRLTKWHLINILSQDLHNTLKKRDKLTLSKLSFAELASLRIALIDAFEKIEVAAISIYQQETTKAISKQTRNMMAASLGKTHIGGKQPFGFVSPDGLQLIRDPTTAKIVCHVFELFIVRQSFNATAKHLNNMGLKSPNGAKWTHVQVSRILRCPTYRGNLEWGKRAKDKKLIGKTTKITGHHRPLVSMKLITRVDKILSIQK